MGSKLLWLLAGMVGMGLLICCAGTFLLGLVSQGTTSAANVSPPQVADGTTVTVQAPTAIPPTRRAGKTETVVGLQMGPVSPYHDGIGSLWFMTEITNTGSVPLQSVKLVITLKDGQGRILGAESGSSDIHVVPAGLRVPVRVLVWGEPEGWTQFDAKPSAEQASAYLQAAYSDRFEVLQSNLASRADRYTLSGAVRNVGRKAVTVTHVVVGLYDAGDHLIGMGDGFTESNDLAPGDSAPFSVGGMTALGPVASHRIWVSGPVK